MAVHNALEPTTRPCETARCVAAGFLPGFVATNAGVATDRDLQILVMFEESGSNDRRG